MQQATSRKVVDMASRAHERQSANSAADTHWSEIARHVNNIDHVAQGLAERWELDDAQAEACQTIQRLCANMRRLQEVQRRGYSRQADEGLVNIAGEFVPAVVRRVYWPKTPAAWLESITLSAAHIARLARERIAAQ